jgi:hypothetical protein
MWSDLKQQLASIFKREVFRSLLRTPSYSIFLQKGGLKPPLEAYTKDYGRPAIPASFEGTCDTYASLIVARVKQLNCLAEDHTLRAEIIRGPLALYRAMQSRRAGPEPDDLRRGTADIGDWWFCQDVLAKCVEYCRAFENARKQNPLLSDMSPDRCLKVQLRRRLAIRIDWNAIAAIRRLTLDSDESIPAITGVGLPMAIYSSNADWRKFKNKSLPAARHELPGGDRQIWVPFTPQKTIQLWTPKGGLTACAQL